MPRPMPPRSLPSRLLCSWMNPTRIFPTRLVLVTLATLSLVLSLAAKKKKPEEITQTLELPKDPPMVAVGETKHLSFLVSPLSAKGLLSQQTRDALKAILRVNGGAPLVHIRAFVAGS